MRCHEDNWHLFFQSASRTIGVGWFFWSTILSSSLGAPPLTGQISGSRILRRSLEPPLALKIRSWILPPTFCLEKLDSGGLVPRGWWKPKLSPSLGEALERDYWRSISLIVHGLPRKLNSSGWSKEECLWMHMLPGLNTWPGSTLKPSLRIGSVGSLKRDWGMGWRRLLLLCA